VCHAYVVVRICRGRSWHVWCVYVGCVGMFQVTPCGVPPASIRRIIARPTLIVSFSAPLCAPALSMYTTSFRSRFLFCPPCLTAGVLGRVFGTIPRCCVCFRSLTGLRGAAASFRPVPCTETFESCVCGVCPFSGGTASLGSTCSPCVAVSVTSSEWSASCSPLSRCPSSW